MRLQLVHVHCSTEAIVPIVRLRWRLQQHDHYGGAFAVYDDETRVARWKVGLVGGGREKRGHFQMRWGE